MERPKPIVRGHPTCPYCKDEVRPEQPKRGCEGCMAWGHAECWGEHGVCPACGAATPTSAVTRIARPAAARWRVPRVPPPQVDGQCTRRWCSEPVNPSHQAQGECERHRLERWAGLFLVRLTGGVLVAALLAIILFGTGFMLDSVGVPLALSAATILILAGLAWVRRSRAADSWNHAVDPAPRADPAPSAPDVAGRPTHSDRVAE